MYVESRDIGATATPIFRRVVRLGRSSVVLAALSLATALQAQEASTTHELGIKYMRDSEEYAALARQIYRLAGDSVSRSAQGLAGKSWAVIMDVDETTLDNSPYALERSVTGLPVESVSWNAWVRRREAGAVPGVVQFVAIVRRAGGRIAWITNRDAITKEDTRANLQRIQLWGEDDRLCPQDNASRTKAIRRAEVLSGHGACSWSGNPVRVLAFVGDQMGDFPTATEQIPDTGSDGAFGRTCFLLPNSMYGQWTTRVTRPRPSADR